MPDRLAGPDRAPAARVLEEELRPLGVVDQRVDVLDGALLDPRVARALVRHAGAPDLGRLERKQELVRVGEREPVGVERRDAARRSRVTTTPLVDDAALDAVRAADPDAEHQ